MVSRASWAWPTRGEPPEEVAKEVRQYETRFPGLQRQVDEQETHGDRFWGFDGYFFCNAMGEGLLISCDQFQLIRLGMGKGPHVRGYHGVRLRSHARHQHVS